MKWKLTATLWVEFKIALRALERVKTRAAATGDREESRERLKDELLGITQMYLKREGAAISETKA